MQGLNKLLVIIVVLFISLINTACKREIEKNYIYQVDEIKINESNSNKNLTKSDLEFISVAYSDLFEKPIPTEELGRLINAYNSIGDRNIIIDMIIRGFLRRPEANIPHQFDIQDEPEKFIERTYKKFYIRKPTEYEKSFWVNQIKTNTKLTPELIYYSFLTSNEYRHY